MKVTTVYLIRHGETDWNAQFRFQGQTDIPLNSNGESQAHSLRPHLTKLKPQMILSSDLGRAVKTAEIASLDLNLEISIHPELRETNLGETEGLRRDEIVERFGAEMIQRWHHSHNWDFAFPGGETKHQHWTRLNGFLTRFLLANPHLDRIAVVTHGGCIRRLVDRARGAPSEPEPVPNCVVHSLSFAHEILEWTDEGQITDESL